MSVMAISPVSFVNAPSMVNIEEPRVQSHLQEDSRKAKTQALSDVSSSGSAVAATQAFTAFQPDVQPIASLSPSTDMSTLAVPPGQASDSTGSPTQWSGAIVDVYA
jgi:hypothetical protein